MKNFLTQRAYACNYPVRLFEWDDGVWARIFAGLAVILLFLAFARYKVHGGALVREINKRCCPHRILTFDNVPGLIPSILAMLAFAVITSTLLLVNFFGAGGVDTDATAFLVDPAAMGDNPGAEISARGLWGLTFAAICLGVVAICWVCADVFAKTHISVRHRFCFSFVPLAVLFGVLFWSLASVGLAPGYGSRISVEMLCSTWARTNLIWLGPITDGLNVLTVGICVLLAGAFSLLQTSATRKSRKFWSRLIDLIQVQELSDRLLYVGAAVLVTGLLLVVATLAWSYAPFPGVADMKGQMDICRISTPPTASRSPEIVSKPGMTLDIDACKRIRDKMYNAEVVDDLKQFSRGVAILFGAAFSALLLLMYLPVALMYQRRVQELAECRPADMDLAELDALLASMGIERTLLKRSVNVLAALGPFVIGVLSTVFGL